MGLKGEYANTMGAQSMLRREDSVSDMGLKGQYANTMVVQAKLSREEFASSMVQ